MKANAVMQEQDSLVNVHLGSMARNARKIAGDFFLGGVRGGNIYDRNKCVDFSKTGKTKIQSLFLSLVKCNIHTCQMAFSPKSGHVP